MSGFVLGFAIVESYQSSKHLVHRTSKHLLEVIFLSQKKTLIALLEKLSLIDKFKLLKQGCNNFLEHFQLFQSSHSVDVMQILLLIFRCFPYLRQRIFDVQVFQNLLRTRIRKNSYFRNFRKKERSKSSFIVKTQAI